MYRLVHTAAIYCGLPCDPGNVMGKTAHEMPNEVVVASILGVAPSSVPGEGNEALGRDCAKVGPFQL